MESRMISVKQYLVFGRAPFLTASVIPAILGTALAYHFDGVFNLINFSLVLFGLVFAHLGVNLANDYYDFEQGADQNNNCRNQFSGGSPHLGEGREKPKLFKHLFWGSFAVAALCGLLLVIRVDQGIGPVFWLMLAGFIGGYYYTAPPLKFAYRGWGELFILLNFGVLPLLGTYYVQTHTLSIVPIIAGIPVGFLITNVLWINQFPDYHSDKESGKATLVVRMGTAKARFLYLAFLASAALFILLGPTLFDFPMFYLVGILTLIPAVVAGRILFRYHQDPPNLLKGQALTIMAHFATGVGLTIGLLI